MSKKKIGKCKTPFCRNPAQLTRRGGIPTNYCSKCYKRQWRAKNVESDAYLHLLDSARRRKISFTLTKKEWHDFCQRTGYLENKGTSSQSLAVDRIDERRGYSIDNIRVLTVEWNSRRNFIPYFQDHPELTSADPF